MEGVYGIFTRFRKIIPLKRFVQTDNFILYRKFFYEKHSRMENLHFLKNMTYS